MDPWSFSVKRHELILLWESFLYTNSRIRPRNVAKFHFCTCLLIQISYIKVTDMSFTQQTVFHSIGGRKKLRNFFPFPSLQDCCSQEGFVQPCVKWLSNGTNFIPLEKHSSQPRRARCCWNSPDKPDPLYLAYYLSHLQIFNYWSCKTPSASSFHWNGV